MRIQCAIGTVILSLIFVSLSTATPVHFLRGQHAELTTSTGSNNTLYNATLVVPLHEKSGTMHLTVNVGQPSVAKTLIVDTGSRLAAWTCRHRDHHHHYDSMSLSSSTTLQPVSCGSCQYPGAACNFHDGSCRLTQKYTEGSSWTAVEVQDVVSLTLIDTTTTTVEEDALELSALIFRFGCQTQWTGLFQQQYADGILGVERSDYSLVYHMHQQGLLPSNSFSICMSTHQDGIMGFGGALRERHLETMAYTPIVRDNVGLYGVQVLEVWIGDTCLACDDDHLVNALNTGPGTVLDSGTTDTYLPVLAKDEFAIIWLQETGLSFLKRSKRFTYDEFLRLPDIRIVFKSNVTLQVSPVSYMEGATAEAWTGTRELANRIYVNEPRGAVLGMNVQRDYDIHYEADRVGFAKADCRQRRVTDAEAVSASL